MAKKPRELEDILSSFDEYAKEALDTPAGVGILEYIDKIRDRLVVAWGLYGNGTRQMSSERIIGEATEEALDVPGWLLFYYERTQDQRCVHIFVRAFELWRDIEELKSER